MVLIPFIRVSLLFCCWCWQGVDSLCSFVFICAAKEPMRCRRWQHLNNLAAVLERCWKLSDTFRYLFLLKRCAVNNIPPCVWIFSTIKVNKFFFYSISVSCLGLGNSDLNPGFEEKPGLSDRRERLLRKITRNPGRHLHNGVISWILAKPAPTFPVLSLLIINIKEPVKQIIMDHNWTIKKFSKSSRREEKELWWRLSDWRTGPGGDKVKPKVWFKYSLQID